MATFASYAAPQYYNAGTQLSYAGAHHASYAAAPLQTYSTAPAPAPVQQTYPGPNGKGWDVEEGAPGTEISAEVCQKIGVPIGSKWGPAPANPYPQHVAPAAPTEQHAVPYGYSSVPYPSNYSTLGPH